MPHSLRTLALFTLVAPLGCLPSPECKNSVHQQLLAPAGDLKAVMFTRECGATTGFSTQVSIVTEESTPANGGNVLVLDDNHGRAPTDSSGGLRVLLEWRGVDTLSITHDARARVFKAERLVQGVVVLLTADSLP